MRELASKISISGLTASETSTKLPLSRVIQSSARCGLFIVAERPIRTAVGESEVSALDSKITGPLFYYQRKYVTHLLL